MFDLFRKVSGYVSQGYSMSTVLPRGTFFPVLCFFLFTGPDALSPQHGEHRYNDLNDADPGNIPEEVRELLQDMTQMEEMLCALASPCFLMWSRREGNSKREET